MSFTGTILQILSTKQQQQKNAFLSEVCLGASCLE